MYLVFNDSGKTPRVLFIAKSVPEAERKLKSLRNLDQVSGIRTPQSRGRNPLYYHCKIGRIENILSLED